MKNKSSISEAKYYGEIGEFRDASDLSEIRDENEAVIFEVDLQSENYEINNYGRHAFSFSKTKKTI